MFYEICGTSFISALVLNVIYIFAAFCKLILIKMIESVDIFSVRFRRVGRVTDVGEIIYRLIMN